VTDGKMSMSKGSGEDKIANDCNDGTTTTTSTTTIDNCKNYSDKTVQPPIAKKKKNVDDDKNDCEQNDPTTATTPTISSLASSEVSIWHGILY
jgi:CO dehydrogenase/acetyl-CoA synthase beta subunit